MSEGIGSALGPVISLLIQPYIKGYSYQVATFGIIIGVLNMLAFCTLPADLSGEDEDENDSKRNKQFIDVPYYEFFIRGRSLIIMLYLFVAGYIGAFYEPFLEFYFDEQLKLENQAGLVFTTATACYSVGAFLFANLAPRVNSHALVIFCFFLVGGSAVAASCYFYDHVYVIYGGLSSMEFFGVGILVPAIPLTIDAVKSSSPLFKRVKTEVFLKTGESLDEGNSMQKTNSQRLTKSTETINNPNDTQSDEDPSPSNKSFERNQA